MEYIRNKAFTLIELLIVIAIIAILAVAIIIAVNPGEQLAKARDATRERHVNAVESAVYTYHIDNLEFPADLANSLGSEICNTNIISSNECGDLIDLSPLVEEGYLPQIPINPTTEKNTSSTGYNIVTVEDKVAVWPTESETRQIGSRVALEFDGESGYINTDFKTADYFQENDPFTITLWGFFNSYTPEHEQFDFRKTGLICNHNWHTVQNSGGFCIALRDKRLRVFYASDSEQKEYNFNTAIMPLNQWHHIVYIYDGQNILLYLNKKEEGLYSPEFSWEASDRNTWIGRNTQGGWTNDYFDGSIYDVRIYNRILYESEIQSLYKGQHIGEGLVGYWPIKESQGCVIYDHSNNNHGILNPNCPENSPKWVVGI